MAARVLGKFPAHLKEVRIHLCQTSPQSQGVRDFIETAYVPLKQANPKFPILIRECSGVEAKAWARFEYGRESCVPLANLTKDQVAATISSLGSL